MTVLRVYTEYSLFEGECRANELIDRAVELSYTAVAKTDKGTLASSPEFCEEARRKNINPIIGCEVSTFKAGEKLDLLLLAKNNDGLSALNVFSSFAMTEGTVPPHIFPKYAQNIIAVLLNLEEIFRKSKDGAEKSLLAMKECFSEFYVGIERIPEDSAEQIESTKAIYEFCKKSFVKCVISTPVYMTRKESGEILSFLEYIKHGEITKEEHPYYLREIPELKSLFSDLPFIWENTEAIGKKCNVSFDTSKLHLPSFPTSDAVALLREKAAEGLKKLCLDNNEKYINRLEAELSTIEKMGFSDYFLITEDFVSYAKENGIPVGPGRGSGVGSLTAYALGITTVDPVENGLIFQRFLNEERVTMPDFDIDFGDERREEVINYVREKYGKKHVCGIANYSRFAFRQVIRDVASYLKWDASELIKNIPDKTGITVDEAISQSKELEKAVSFSKNAREAVRICKLLEGRPRTVSSHPSGIILTKEPAVSYVPLMSVQSSNMTLTQYSMDTCAKLGLLKIDFLGIKYLTVIDKAKKLIKERYGEVYTDAPPEDDRVYKMLCDGDSSGIFQLESQGMKELLKKLQPSNMDGLTDLISLYRPGPKIYIDSYIKGKKDPSSVSYPFEEAKASLESTYGCPIYQEQIMSLCRDAAGFTLGHADIVRRAMAKKDSLKMKSENEAFVKGCESNGIDKEKASALFEQISSFAKYAFNKSHAVAYAKLAYETAYLKRIYPREYFSARLDSVAGQFSKIYEYSLSVRKLGFELLPPSVNRSDSCFSPCEEGIIYGLASIKGVGIAVADKIVKERKKGGEYTSADDFISRVGSTIGSTAAVALAKSGALDCFGENRATLTNLCEDTISAGTFSSASDAQMTLSFDSPALLNYPRRKTEEYAETDLRIFEKEYTGVDFYHPLKLQKGEKKYALYIKLTESNRNNLPLVMEKLSSDSKDCVVRIYDEASGKTAELKDAFFKNSESNLSAINKLMGSDNVKLKALERNNK
ncbi:MAG: DNA polymerase III subunit alpha [Ruminococcaceae bacterium]|nr:DNA polymerase III subunit alpha [Oscillospiraceae bacterium]